MSNRKSERKHDERMSDDLSSRLRMNTERALREEFPDITDREMAIKQLNLIISLAEAAINCIPPLARLATYSSLFYNGGEVKPMVERAARELEARGQRGETVEETLALLTSMLSVHIGGMVQAYGLDYDKVMERASKVAEDTERAGGSRVVQRAEIAAALIVNARGMVQ